MSKHDDSTPRGIDRKTTSRAALLRRRSTLLLEQSENVREQAEIEAQLAELESDNDVADERSSSNPPRDLQRSKNPRRIIAERCRAGLVAGAIKRGRDWYFTAEAWNASRAKAPKSRPVLAVVHLSEAEAAERDLTAAGLRVTTRRSA